MPKSGSLEEEAQRLLGQLGEAEASLSAAYAEIAALRATVGGPRFEDLKVPGKDYCRHCGVEIFVPRMNEERLGPLMHRGAHHVPYLQCKMLAVAEWEDGHEEPAKEAFATKGPDLSKLALAFLKLPKTRRKQIAEKLDAFNGFVEYDDVVVLSQIRESKRFKEFATEVAR